MRRMRTLFIAGFIFAEILAVHHLFAQEWGWVVAWSVIALAVMVAALFFGPRRAATGSASAPEPFGGYEIHRQPERFVGLVVNLGTKDGSLWVKTTITGVERGELRLTGGTFIPRIYADPIERLPVTESKHCRVYTFDIARGLIHRT